MNKKQKQKLLKLIAAFGEASYRRGFMQGNLSTQFGVDQSTCHKYRYSKPLNKPYAVLFDRGEVNLKQLSKDPLWKLKDLEQGNKELGQYLKESGIL